MTPPLSSFLFAPLLLSSKLPNPGSSMSSLLRMGLPERERERREVEVKRREGREEEVPVMRLFFRLRVLLGRRRGESKSSRLG